MSGIAALFGVLSMATAPVQEADKEFDCSNPGSTLAMNECMAGSLMQQKDALRAYLDLAYVKLRGEGQANVEPLIVSIEENQKAWEAYAQGACGSVWDYWGEGTIRNYMSGNCQTDLTRERMHHIWREYLIANDGDPLAYPEPPRGGDVN